MHNQNNYKYDECAYNQKGKLLTENLNCSFSFWFGDNKAIQDGHTLVECKVADVYEIGQDIFRNIVYGNTLFSSYSENNNL